ncbi:periplasmic monoheme cytochrome c [Geothrix oryzae]|jgi:cytochrome c5|uniref:Periplasmic monoheme cytochrome c n=1 Tax=Geothrix oryzae TaxID=2927975 RepID=A0ABM8DSX3_9BACT|nr:cytochrome c [Geothrix oryzae]BDU70148.1 periplasmic monoheme cytochrome c [Geothrix oryzae]
MRNTLKLLAVVAALSASLAAQGGSDTKGKFFFKKNCKSCHAPGGSAKEITPLSKTQAQWKAYFAAGKHKKGAEKLDGLLKPEQVKDVQTFLVNHASDSPQPETCGG